MPMRPPASPRRRSAAALAAALLLAAPAARAQAGGEAGEEASRPWYERLSLRGYAQVRYNRLLETNPELVCAQCDRSIGGDGGFFVRRARLVVSGDVHPRVSVYIQPDLATALDGEQHGLQMRDLYADVFLDSGRTLRVRVGQSKVPWGFENLQSSSNRVPFDRDDAINSGMPNERDLGLVAMWAPGAARRRFRTLADSGLKGTGDYGVVAVAVMNGQSGNQSEANGNKHVVARLAYPFRLGNGQFVELGVQGYHGRFVLLDRSGGVAGPDELTDERVAGSLVVYPQPIGLQAEWTTGKGPAYDAAANAVASRTLRGGYVQTMARVRWAGQQLIPYARLQSYDGGKKHELDARLHRVREFEIGAEWLPIPALELTAAWATSHRRTADGANAGYDETGQLLRLQAQFNY